MSVISMKQLLEAGVHFGHQTRRWNPKMAPYIYTERNGIYIIDLQQSVGMVDDAYNAVADIVANGGNILFVGTKKQAQDAIKTEAERCGQFYVNERWLGGMLTNFKTIQSRIAKLKEIETMESDGTFDVLPKKEVIALRKELDKLQKNLGGIKEMKRIPDAIFVVDPKKEKIYKIYSIEEISEMSFTNPNCVLLMKAPNCALQRPALGIPDTKFILLNDRTKMITKAPIRVIDLSLLELHNSRYFWDIGACTGSVSIEARRQYPHLDIQAFEVRKECENIIRANTRLHSAPGIDLRIGNFLNLSIEKNTIVDAVFIGGHGGKLKEIIRKVASHLNSLNGKIVFNSVSEESSKLFREAVAENGLKLHSEINITLDSNNPITILCATGKNYV